MNLLECSIPERLIQDFRLKNISFQLEAGYIMSVIGENGAGKTTLLKALMGGLELTNNQEVMIGGNSMIHNSRAAKQQMAFVLHQCPFPMQLTIRDNIRLFAPLYEKWDAQIFERWRTRFGLDEKMPLRKLSKGQQMKFQLAFALSYEASVYFMDEPSANLDVEFRMEFYQILRELVADGTKSVVYVTQLVEELDGLADYVLWLEEGRQLLFLDMEELQERFGIVSGRQQSIDAIPKNLLVGKRCGEHHQEAMIDEWQGKLMLPLQRRRARVEEIMFYFAENPKAMFYCLVTHNEKKPEAKMWGGSV